MKENKHAKDINTKLRVKAPDETLYEIAAGILKEYEEAQNEETQKELERFEGILWARYKQLKKWEKMISKRCDEGETKKLLDRRIKCLVEINKIRKALRKELYGDWEIT